MFVYLKKIAAITVLATSSICLAASSAFAAETGSLTVNLTGVEQGGGPLYVSVQKREDFMQERGTSGGIYKNVTGGDLSYDYALVPTGEYSVMIWHDTDADGVFTTDAATHMPLDGWGASGPELKGAPTFDDIKIYVGPETTELTIEMHYP